MSSRRQTVDKLDRTITRLYTYLSGSEEGEDGNEPSCSSAGNPPSHHQQPHRGRRSQPPQRGSSNNNSNFQQHHQQQQQEPEYQQPYAYPPAHAHPFNPTSYNTSSSNHGPHFVCLNPQQTGNSLGGSTPTSNNSSDHASEITFTESELALTHQGTLPISNNGTGHLFFFSSSNLNTFDSSLRFRNEEMLSHCRFILINNEDAHKVSLCGRRRKWMHHPARLLCIRGLCCAVLYL